MPSVIEPVIFFCVRRITLPGAFDKGEIAVHGSLRCNRQRMVWRVAARFEVKDEVLQRWAVK
jgi:hypothetical protein